MEMTNSAATETFPGKPGRSFSGRNTTYRVIPGGEWAVVPGSTQNGSTDTLLKGLELYSNRLFRFRWLSVVVDSLHSPRGVGWGVKGESIFSPSTHPMLSVKTTSVNEPGTAFNRDYLSNILPYTKPSLVTLP